mmetsp:Transcript_57964/g.114950  ORF Transcript_57964/g.114950 Transcript_57964/m.114950 type:complete len:170 (-) Transcript_57964:195-704(-)
MRTLLSSWAFALCLFSVFRGSATECSKASSEDEACEKMLLVTKKLPDEQSNAFLEEESEEGLEETEQATDKKPMAPPCVIRCDKRCHGVKGPEHERFAQCHRCLMMECQEKKKRKRPRLPKVMLFWRRNQKRDSKRQSKQAIKGQKKKKTPERKKNLKKRFLQARKTGK